MQKIAIVQRFVAFSIFCLASSLILSGAARAGSLYGLQDIHSTNTRLLFDLEASRYDGLRDARGYVPVYEVTVENVLEGDILKLSGQIEASEKNGKLTYLGAYLRVTRPDGVERRAGPVAYQYVVRDSNHHMPLNLFGRFEARMDGDYKIELIARAPNAEHINLDMDDSYFPLQDSGAATKSVWVEYIAVDGPASGDVHDSDFGHLTAEHFRHFADKRNLNAAGPLGAFSAETAFIPENDVDVLTPTPTELGTLGEFELRQGDIVRVQTMVKAQFLSDDDFDRNIFSTSLKMIRGTSGNRLAVATENMVRELFRFSLQNEGFYKARHDGDNVSFVQEAQGLHPASRPERTYRINGRHGQMSSLHFRSWPDGMPKTVDEAFYPVQDAPFMANGHDRKILSWSGSGKNGDILRVQSQVQFDLDAATGVKCRARIEVYEDQKLRDVSVWDERFLRNDYPIDGHDYRSGSYAPFTVHVLKGGDIDVHMVGNCDQINGTTPPLANDVKVAYLGTGLFIEKFGSSLSNGPPGQPGLPAPGPVPVEPEVSGGVPAGVFRRAQKPGFPENSPSAGRRPQHLLLAAHPGQ